MKNFRLSTALLVLLTSLAISHCSAATFESSSSSSSHYAGTNCLSCHNSGSKSMTVAGTVYTGSAGSSAQTSGNLKVTIGSGSNKYEIPVDASGNFYTDYPVNFPVSVSVSNGNAMNANVSNGNCNTSGCHDSSKRIY